MTTSPSLLHHPEDTSTSPTGLIHRKGGSVHRSKGAFRFSHELLNSQCRQLNWFILKSTTCLKCIMHINICARSLRVTLLVLQWEKLNVLLSLQLWEYLGSSAAGVPQLQRYKRDWVIPTRTLKENFDYSTAGYVAKVRNVPHHVTSVF